MGDTNNESVTIPKIWKKVSLEKIAKYINGYPFKPSQWRKKGLPIIRIQNLTGSSNSVNYFDENIDKKYKVIKNDLLISWSASLGVFKWSGVGSHINPSKSLRLIKTI